MSGTAAVVAIDSVSRHYETLGGVVRAVDGLTCEIERESSVAITGPSGCGKSTLLALVAGLEVPTAGRVLLDGMEVSALSDSERARLRREALGLVFQADNLLPFLTVVENVALQLALHGANDGYDRCLQLLDELGLAEHVHKFPDQLSGGQRQRVAIARALIHRPRLILADEPTGSLDPHTSTAVLDLLLDAREQMDATLVMVTHDLGVARRLDRRLGLVDGKLVEDVAATDHEPEREVIGA